MSRPVQLNESMNNRFDLYLNDMDKHNNLYGSSFSSKKHRFTTFIKETSASEIFRFENVAPVIGLTLSGAAIGTGIGCVVGGPKGIVIGAGVGAGVGLTTGLVFLAIKSSKSYNHWIKQHRADTEFVDFKQLFKSNNPDEDLNCPITQEFMVDPVITPYGHVFERVALEQSLQRKQECPLTRKPLKIEDLRQHHPTLAKHAKFCKEILDVKKQKETLTPFQKEGLEKLSSDIESQITNIFEAEMKILNDKFLKKEISMSDFKRQMDKLIDDLGNPEDKK